MAPVPRQVPGEAVRERRRPTRSRPAPVPTAPSLGYRSQPSAARRVRRDDHAGWIATSAGWSDLLGTRAASIGGRWCCSSATTARTWRAAPIRSSSRARAGLRGIKRDLYEGGIRVPMIARWTGTIPAGRVSDHAWAHWDVLPTLAELAGGRAPARTRRHVDGARAARRAAAHAPVLLLGVPRARLSAGRSHGPLEGGAAEAGRAAGAVRSRRRSSARQHDVAAAHPDIVAKIEAYLKTARTESERWPAATGAAGG